MYTCMCRWIIDYPKAWNALVVKCVKGYWLLAKRRHFAMAAPEKKMFHAVTVCPTHLSPICLPSQSVVIRCTGQLPRILAGGPGITWWQCDNWPVKFALSPKCSLNYTLQDSDLLLTAVKLEWYHIGYAIILIYCSFSN